jgi:Cu/Ag efflux protein CusF
MRLAGVVVCLLTIACSRPAPLEKKSYTFRGKVEAVDKNAKNLTVNGENVEGWMGAMTMEYKVDDPSVLDKVSPGDQITATVYDGDEILHRVEIAGKGGDSKSQ